MKYVLDTNIVTLLLRGDERVLSHLADVELSSVGIPLLVLAELLFAAEKSVRKEQNGARIKPTTNAFPMLPLGLAVVRRYAAERAQLERIGRKKSDFGLMIAGSLLAGHAGGFKTGRSVAAANQVTGSLHALIIQRFGSEAASYGSPAGKPIAEL